MKHPKYKPVIVVVAYNRPVSLKRILSSLKNSRNISDVSLIISIDHKAPENNDVLEIANSFEWPFGEKEVIYQEESLGLRKHIIKCGDLSMKYGSVIILEDDLYVSPYFYEYACEALDFYDEDLCIAGISLYNQAIEEITGLPFRPISDDSDVYFLQHPSSWGQAWTSAQWGKFKNWYLTDPDLFQIQMPDFIRRRWPETSWKKYFCGYLAAENKFFVYPRISLTTNFNDPGTNYKSLVNHDGQAHLKIFNGKPRFKAFSDSNCKYDSHLELTMESLKKLSSGFDDYELELDLYGTKDPRDIKSSFVITSKPSSNPIKGFKRALKPHDMNIIMELPGEDICLSKTEDVLPVKDKHSWKTDNYKYFYSRKKIGIKTQLYNHFLRLFER